MSNILCLSPLPISAAVASRGSGAANLLSFEPKEIWRDNAVGTAVLLTLDLGAVRSIDTISLVALYGAAPDATWAISGGLATQSEFWIQNADLLRAPDAPGQQPYVSHAFWHGEALNVRYIGLTITQPVGSAPLSIGRALAGVAFVPDFNMEWGSGRRVIDTGVATALASGGFAVVPGVRKGSYNWTLGDLSDDEVEALYNMQLAHGETVPMLVVEDPDHTAGLRNRIHYGLFRSLKAYERREQQKSRWEMTVEQWV